MAIEQDDCVELVRDVDVASGTIKSGTTLFVSSVIGYGDDAPPLYNLKRIDGSVALSAIEGTAFKVVE